MKQDHGDDVDAIMIFLGTNDYNAGVPIGEWFTETVEKTVANGKEVERKKRTPVFDNSTFRGRINIALDRPDSVTGTYSRQKSTAILAENIWTPMWNP